MFLQLPKLTTRLMLVLIAAAVVRFALAPITALEFRSDTILFQIWGYEAHERGLLNMYNNLIQYFNGDFYSRPINYLPPYLYILYAIEWTRRIFSGWIAIGSPLASLLIKTPAILFELGAVLLLSKIISQESGEKWALRGAVIYAFLPAIIFTTAVWGQVDSIHTFFLILTVWFIQRKRLLLATIFWTIAFFFKMQSLALLPLLIYEIVRLGYLQVLKSVLVGVSTMVIINLPFLLTGKILEIISLILFTPGSYPRLSINAFNVWWLAAGGYGFTMPDDLYAFGLPLVVIGAIFFTLATYLALWFRSNIRSSESLWLTAAFLYFSFFMLPTEMHERYLFPFFALLLPALPSAKWIRWLFTALSITFLINLSIAWKIGGTDIPGALWLIALAVAGINTILFLATAYWITVQTRRHKALVRVRQSQPIYET